MVFTQDNEFVTVQKGHTGSVFSKTTKTMFVSITLISYTFPVNYCHVILLDIPGENFAERSGIVVIIEYDDVVETNPYVIVYPFHDKKTFVPKN